MFKFKHFFIIFILSLLLIFSTNLSIYASVPVTEENLNTALQDYASSITENKYKITMSNGIITIVEKGTTNKVIIDYDLSENPTFTISVPIQQGMSYNDFREKTESLIDVMIGYVCIANIQGVSFENAASYIGFKILFNALSSMSNNSSKYIIASDDSIISSDDSTVIYESDFGNHVMEYVNSIYSTKQTYSDNEEGLNSFTWTQEQTDVTQISCNLVSTLTVNLDADFSKIDELMESVDPFKDITEQNADYVLKLKVGQKCKILSNEKINGYSASNPDCVEVDYSQNIISAIKEGISKVYLYFNENEILHSDELYDVNGLLQSNSNIETTNKRKSIYIIVENNVNNSSLDTITLNMNTEEYNYDSPDKNEKIDSSDFKNNNTKINNIIETNSENNTGNSIENNTNDENKVANISVMPRTGEKQNPILIMSYILIALSITGIFSLIITRKKS